MGKKRPVEETETTNPFKANEEINPFKANSDDPAPTDDTTDAD